MTDQVVACFAFRERTEHLNYFGTKPEKQTLFTCKFNPVSQSDGRTDAQRAEFTKFWNASPSGEITLGTVNEEAARFFKLGRSYRVTFELIPDDAAA